MYNTQPHCIMFGFQFIDMARYPCEWSDYSTSLHNVWVPVHRYGQVPMWVVGLSCCLTIFALLPIFREKHPAMHWRCSTTWSS